MPQTADRGGEILKVLLDRKGLLPHDVAQVTKLRKSEFTRWIRHKQPVSRTVRIIDAIAGVLRVDPNDLWSCLRGELHPDYLLPPTLQQMRDGLPEEWVKVLYQLVHSRAYHDRILHVLTAFKDKILDEEEAARQ